MEESHVAQLVVQHVVLTKLNQSLHAKEEKKKDDHTVLFLGSFGRHLTSTEFSQVLAEQNQQREDKEAQKVVRMEG
jgi:hypothetical protein